MVCVGLSRVCGTTFEHIIGSGGSHYNYVFPIYLVILIFHSLLDV